MHLGGVLLVEIGAVVHQYVGAPAEIRQFLNEFLVGEIRIGWVEFVVGDVAEAASVMIHAIAETVAGMFQVNRLYLDSIQVQLLLADLVKGQVGPEFTNGPISLCP